jgi:hypothetical protein
VRTLRAGGGNCILRSTALGSFLATACRAQKPLGSSERGSDNDLLVWSARHLGETLAALELFRCTVVSWLPRYRAPGVAKTGSIRSRCLGRGRKCLSVPAG